MSLPPTSYLHPMGLLLAIAALIQAADSASQVSKMARPQRPVVLAYEDPLRASNVVDHGPALVSLLNTALLTLGSTVILLRARKAESDRDQRSKDEMARKASLEARFQEATEDMAKVQKELAVAVKEREELASENRALHQKVDAILERIPKMICPYADPVQEIAACRQEAEEGKIPAREALWAKAKEEDGKKGE